MEAWHAVLAALAVAALLLALWAHLRERAEINRALHLAEQGRADEAVRILRRLHLVDAKIALAGLLAKQGKADEALAVLRATLDRCRGRGGDLDNDALILKVQSALADVEVRLARERREPQRPAAALEPPAGGPAVGDRVGPYVLEWRVAEGGFGQVWKARKGGAGKPVALKIPTEAGYVAGLRRQGRIQSRLADPRIVSVLESDLACEPPYIAMEYVEGQNLRSVLRREGRLVPERAARLFREILLAVEAAHDAGVLHRDLKPENVIVAPGDRIKVTDFEVGEAREEAERPLLRSRGLETAAADGGRAGGGLAGTPAYMAPEQLAGEPVDRRADIWALGMIFFEMLAGRRPQPGDKPSDFVGGLEPAFDAVFARCYTRLEKRFGSVGEVLAALEGARAPGGGR